MVDKIEMSLDDIIKKNKIGYRRQGGAPGASGAVRKNLNGKAPIRRNSNNNNNNQKGNFRGTVNRKIGGGVRPTQQRGSPRIARKFPRVRNTSTT